MPPRISKSLLAGGLMLLLPIGACQPAPGQNQPDHKRREIARYFIDQPEPGSGYETGPLHIVYDDGTDVVIKLPSLQKSTEKEVVFNDVGFADVKLAADKQTIGWTIDVENCCTSYPLPSEFVVFRDGHVLHTLDKIRMVWNWMFVRGGERVAIVSGFSHGPEVGQYQLYDVKTGKLLVEVWGDEKLQALKPDAPQWAKLLEEQLHSR